MTNIKQICAQLIELWDADCDINTEINELRTALAESESEGPTHEEVCDLMHEFTIGTGHGERLDEIGFAYALLARWGRTAPAPQPIPVTKRPPLPEEVV